MKLSDDDRRSRGVVIAPGCGHFIQRDSPVFVSDELKRMLNEIMPMA